MRAYSLRYTVPAVDGLFGFPKRTAAVLHRNLLVLARNQPMPLDKPAFVDAEGHEVFRVFLSRAAVEYWIDHPSREWVVTDIKRFSL